MRFLKLILKLRIERKRKHLYKKVNHLGFTHPEVVNCSQKLDGLLNKYYDSA
ncbi:aspartyl-phosphate phosphatase Spo0E family protein [Solibacillus sp. FSL K6-1781]|uniref:aspartyl-phosphate phosphatase Spo0E family protein n=1 Tax=Solibacillus sp. FSL K6-1781 TaxID=2921474 RepID=UPI00315AE3E5